MLSAHLRKLTAKGFTLIELLVVIGILGALTILALVTLNPAEAQKKARDVQRLRDLATLQSIVEQYMDDNKGAITLASKDSSGAAATASDCGTGWLSNALGTNVNLCPYAKVIPIDPINRNTSVVTSTTILPQNAYYYFRFSGGSYKICTYLESASNRAKLAGDGESNATGSEVVAVYSLQNIACPS